MSTPAEILARFPLVPVSITPHAGGLINRSWRVESAAGPFLLQRLNPDIFADGAGVMDNMRLVSEHLAGALVRRGVADAERRSLRMLRAEDGNAAVQGSDGAWWRVVRFIDGTVVRERVTSAEEAREAGHAFGQFLQLLADLDGSTLVETIPQFRNTARRVTQLDQAVTADRMNRLGAIQRELSELDARREYATLMDARSVPRRVVHNDAKSGNLLRDAVSGEALAVIDLDTVMPGTALSDVGDLIRSTASPTDEDEPDGSKIAVQPGLVEGLARGYLAGSEGALTTEERRLFVVAGLVTTYEQAVRFFTDYLDGDRYYRTSRAGQNLDRGRAQLRLLQSLEDQRGLLERMVTRL